MVDRWAFSMGEMLAAHWVGLMVMMASPLAERKVVKKADKMVVQ